MHQTIVVAGASRGIGLAVAEHYVGRCRRLVAVSRTPAPVGEWLAADLSTRAGCNAVAGAVGGDAVDALLFMGGAWETDAFTRAYAFDRCTDADIERVIGINLVAPIRLTQALLPAMRRSSNPKAIFMGSLSGRDNYPGREVANTGSKFGLRGVVHALRNELRAQRIGVTVINPGNVATPEVIADLSADAIIGGEAVPMADLLAVIDCVMALSRHTCAKEIDLPAMGGLGA